GPVPGLISRVINRARDGPDGAIAAVSSGLRNHAAKKGTKSAIGIRRLLVKTVLRFVRQNRCNFEASPVKDLSSGSRVIVK
ncbi:hypothetical protein SB781_38355, partial [Paraburkholderia sp. SIMBA_061]